VGVAKAAEVEGLVDIVGIGGISIAQVVPIHVNKSKNSQGLTILTIRCSRNHHRSRDTRARLLLDLYACMRNIRHNVRHLEGHCVGESRSGRACGCREHLPTDDGHCHGHVCPRGREAPRGDRQNQARKEKGGGKLEGKSV